jgi:hypothetical protein
MCERLDPGGPDIVGRAKEDAGPGILLAGALDVGLEAPNPVLRHLPIEADLSAAHHAERTEVEFLVGDDSENRIRRGGFGRVSCHRQTEISADVKSGPAIGDHGWRRLVGWCAQIGGERRATPAQRDECCGCEQLLFHDAPAMTADESAFYHSEANQPVMFWAHPFAIITACGGFRIRSRRAVRARLTLGTYGHRRRWHAPGWLKHAVSHSR